MQNDVNIYHIAQLAGVSKSTVSRVLNGHADVSKNTRMRVRQAIEESSYIPNNSARSLPSFSTKTVVLLVCGITNPFFSKIISIILEKMSRSYDVILHSFEPGVDVNIIDAAISICKEKRPKGMILLGGNFEESHEMLRNLHIPIVMASTTIHGCEDRSWFSSISLDDEKEGYKMADYVCKGGHRKIAVIGQYGLREAGIYAAFKEYGVEAAEGELEFDRAYSFLTGYKAAKKLLESDTYTCFLCLSDVFAIGVMKAVLEKGLRIPADVSVVGFDGIENSFYTNPLLTTFVQPFEEIAEKSVSQLLALINKGEPNRHITVLTEINTGGSFTKKT